MFFKASNGARLGSAFILAWLALASLAASGADDDVDPFAKSYLTLELARNYPVSFSQNPFVPGHGHPIVGYRHSLGADWIMGIAAQFKIFDRRDPEEDEQDQVAIWALSHESQYVIRLYHPTYMLIGGKLHYLLPSRGAVFPLQRDTAFETEVGAALSVGLARIVRDRWMVTLRVDRWRGTRTMRFHGVETAMGIAYALD